MLLNKKRDTKTLGGLDQNGKIQVIIIKGI
jgi:hypothetical protein